ILRPIIAYVPEDDIRIVVEVVERNVSGGVTGSVELRHYIESFIIESKCKGGGILWDTGVANRCGIFICLDDAICIEIEQIVIARQFLQVVRFGGYASVHLIP